MASLDTLPPDQRAVLDLVLRRGRSYDDIAQLLAIDRAAVRARALAALDELGPDTGLPSESRALITDYLLGQLPEKVAEQTRDRLAESPYERAWARVIATELGTVASNPMPEIPDGSRAAAAPPKTTPEETPRPKRERVKREPRSKRPERSRVPRPSDRPSSRLGGAIFLLVGGVAVVVIVVGLILVLSSGSSSHSPTTTTNAASAGNTTATTGTGTASTPAAGTTTTSTTAAKVVAQINMNPPSKTGSAKGVAFIVKAGSANGIVIQASGVAANSHNAYAVWLSNTPTDSVRVGFVTPGVGKNGRLQTGGALPSNAAHYKELLLTLETQSNPKTPGPVILQGAMSGLS